MNYTCTKPWEVEEHLVDHQLTKKNSYYVIKSWKSLLFHS